MSAYLVTKNHIDFMVDAARVLRLGLSTPPAELCDGGGWAALPRAAFPAFDAAEFPSILGEALIRANVESLVARYGESARNDGAVLLPYRWTRPAHAFDRDAPGKFALLFKCIACYDYQACEVADYDKTWAGRATADIRDAAIRALPGYDAAPWGI